MDNKKSIFILALLLILPSTEVLSWKENLLEATKAGFLSGVVITVTLVLVYCFWENRIGSDERKPEKFLNWKDLGNEIVILPDENRLELVNVLRQIVAMLKRGRTAGLKEIYTQIYFLIASEEARENSNEKLIILLKSLPDAILTDMGGANAVLKISKLCGLDILEIY